MGKINPLYTYPLKQQPNNNNLLSPNNLPNHNLNIPIYNPTQRIKSHTQIPF